MRKGFTLTELLVCISIIAILIALSLPLLSWIGPTDPNKPVVQTETVKSRWLHTTITKANIEHDGHKFVLFANNYGITSEHHPDCECKRESHRH